MTIAGAGCAGLAAGVALQARGYHVTILEQSDRVGGLAGGIVIHGNTYEYGPHIFHTTDPEVLAEVVRIAGEFLLPFEKTIRIKFLGRYFAFPLVVGDVLWKLPATVVARAALSLVWHAARGAVAGEAGMTDSEKVLQRYYGDVLYRIFFKDYITALWGVPPARLSPAFARQRIPRLDPFNVAVKLGRRLRPWKPKAVLTEGHVEKVEGAAYTTTRGFSAIVEAFAREFTNRGGTLLLNAPVTGVRAAAGKVQAVTYTAAGDAMTIPTDHHISTIPLPLLARMIEPPLPQAALQAATALRFRGTVFVGLLVRRQKVLPASFMYFRERSFNRITDLGQLEVVVQPPGSTLLIAEVTAQPSDRAWLDDAATRDTVVRELVDEGLLAESEIAERHTFKAEFAYPVYALGYEQALASVLEALGSCANLHTIGRQGRFAYVNTHVAFKMGFDAARAVESSVG